MTRSSSKLSRRTAGVGIGAVLALLLAAHPAAAQPAYSQADQARLSGYGLTTDHLGKTAEAQVAMRKILAADPSLQKAMMPVAGEGLDQQFGHLKSLPTMVAAIRTAGLSVEDYGLTSACAIGAHMMAGFAAHRSPPGAADSWAQKMLGWHPSTEQVAFVVGHDAEMRSFLKAVGMER